MDDQIAIGTRAVCSQCGGEIVFVGPYWDHPGEIKPRHPAIPVEEHTLQPVKNWLEGFDERMRKHIRFARHYQSHFSHGAPGHLDLETIATLARYIDFITDQDTSDEAQS